MSKRAIQGTVAGLGLLFLILDSKTALNGAINAVNLCLGSVVPSIFPFLVLSPVLVSAISGQHLPLLRPIGCALGIPMGAEGIFLSGILGGYPTGAQAVCNAWQSGQLSREDTQRMLTFCSNAGPSFIFGILGMKFSQVWLPWLLWGIHILSAVMVAITMPREKHSEKIIFNSSPCTLVQSLKQAVRTMALICGWVVLFRVMLAFIDRWVLWLVPTSVRVGIYGVLELANGCCSLDQVVSEGMRFIICSGMLAFGGICVVMQTASVTGNLGVKTYIFGKILQTLFSIILSTIVQILLIPTKDTVKISPYFVLIPALGILFSMFITRKGKIRGSIPSRIVV